MNSLEFIYHIIFNNVLVSPPPLPWPSFLAPLRAPLLGSEGNLKGKLISFLKSAPLETLELIYHMIFFDFCCYGGRCSAQTAAKTYFASRICCKDSPYQFSAKLDNSKYGLLQLQISVANILILSPPPY